MSKAITKSFKHGMRNHKLYKHWSAMMYRCYGKNSSDYSYYGGRGIKVSDEWHDINNFINDMIDTYEHGLTLDRISVNGDYCKENCKWSTRTTQARNTRPICKSNKSGFRGVSSFKNKWRARISINKKVILIGYFNTKEEAGMAYINYVEKNNLEHNHGWLLPSEYTKDEERTGGFGSSGER